MRRIAEHLECLTYFQDNMSRLGDAGAVERAIWKWVAPSVAPGLLGPYLIQLPRYPQLDECMVRHQPRHDAL